jgi:asparagine synthase (glutamine-hydrolysing)
LPEGPAHFSWNGTWLSNEAAALIHSESDRETVREAIPNMIARLKLQENLSLLQLQHGDIAEYLPNDILAKVDRMSMAHGLETRAPFLNHHLAEWALKRPDSQKIGPGGELKTMLRLAARKTFGTKIADRPKKGFSIPVHAWIRGPLAEVVRDLLSPSSIKRLNVLDSSRVEAIVDEHFSGRKSYGFELWGLAVLSAWHRARIEHPPEPPKKLPLVERRFKKV